MDPDPTWDKTPFFFDFKDANKKMCSHFFLITGTQAQSLESKKCYFPGIISLSNTFIRKGKDPEPDPEPDPDPLV